jgi:hypothetical protein
MTPDGVVGDLELSYGFRLRLVREPGAWRPLQLLVASRWCDVNSAGTIISTEASVLIERAFALEAGELNAREAQIARLELDEAGEQVKSLTAEQVVIAWACPACGKGLRDQSISPDRAGLVVPPRCFECNGIEPGKQTLMDGVSMIPTHFPVRRLPDAFKRIDGVRPLGINSRYLANLARRLTDSPRLAAVPLADVGGFVDNAVLVLRYVAETAGLAWNEGRLEVPEDGKGVVRWIADAGEGIGAE